MKANYDTINFLMNKRGMTMTQLAESSGITRNTLRNIRKGKGSRKGTIENISRALNVDPDVLRKEIILVDLAQLEELSKAIKSVKTNV